MNLVKFVQFNKPNKNGRYYTRECIENALKHVTKQEFLVQTGLEAKSLADVVALAKNIRTTDNFLVGDCYFFENAKQYEGMNISIRPIGSGTTNEKGEVQDDYRILGFMVVTPDQNMSDLTSGNVSTVEAKNINVEKI